MEWKDIGETIKNIAPGAETLCKVLSLIPGAGTIAAGAQLGIEAVTKIFGLSPDAKPDDVQAAIKADPQAAMKILQADNEYKLAVLRVELDETKAILESATTQVQSINATMQAETRAEIWPQYSWRPFVGFCVGLLALMVGLTVIISYVGVMFGAKPEILGNIPAMLGAVAAVIATISPILGIASYFRGRMQQQGQARSER